MLGERTMAQTPSTKDFVICAWAIEAALSKRIKFLVGVY